MDVVIDRPLDLDDLDATPDDGNRYEVLDGAIVMTPPPSTDHQGVAGELFVLLRQGARPLGLRVLMAPVAWRIGPGQVPEPDLIVSPADAVTERAIVAPPVLVVEILSASNRNRDLSEKRRIYAEGSATWYWIVDPKAPSLTAFRLAGAQYDEMAPVSNADAYETDDPSPVRVVPAELLR